MRRFEYVRPSSVAEATRFLNANADESLVIGGGTAAVVLLSMGILRPAYVVDLGGLAELRGMTNADGGIRLGALVSIRALEQDPTVREGCGLLSEAASQVANVRVRNMATVGGSISYGEPQTDVPPALIALDASVSIAGANGHRDLELEEFFLGPYETALEPGEILTGVSIPAVPRHSGGCHLKFTVGSPENKPVANVSALVTLDPSSGSCVAARIVLGAAGPVPVVATKAMGRLHGERVDGGHTETLIAEAARLAAEQSDPQDDLRGPVWYKRRIIQVLVEKALTCALQRARATLPAA